MRNYNLLILSTQLLILISGNAHTTILSKFDFYLKNHRQLSLNECSPLNGRYLTTNNTTPNSISINCGNANSVCEIKFANGKVYTQTSIANNLSANNIASSMLCAVDNLGTLKLLLIEKSVNNIYMQSFNLARDANGKLNLLILLDLQQQKSFLFHKK